MYALVGLDNIFTQLQNATTQQDQVEEYDPAQNVYSKLELDPEKKLKKLE